MSRLQSNGLVELHDAKLDSKTFMCFDLINFLHNDEETKGFENRDAWHEKFTQAKSGNCPYRDKCQRYARTMERHKGEPRQLTLF